MGANKCPMNLLRNQLSYQVIMDPIRIVNTLDLVICNNVSVVINYHQTKNILISDHNTIFLTMNMVSKTPCKHTYDKKDYYTYDCYKYKMRMSKPTEYQWTSLAQEVDNEDWTDESQDWSTVTKATVR